MTLHPAIAGDRGNSYCGPAALASVFGITPDDAARVIRRVTGKVRVLRLRNRQLEAALNELGRYDKVVEVTHEDGKTRLYHGTLERLADLLDKGVYIVSVTGHYVALDTRTMEVCDNHTMYPLPLKRYRMRRKRVKCVWLILGAHPLLLGGL